LEIQNVPFITTDWESIVPTKHPGENGFASWRTFEVGNIRVRLVEYSPGSFVIGIFHEFILAHSFSMEVGLVA
jgi:hypothetical protein